MASRTIPLPCSTHAVSGTVGHLDEASKLRRKLQNRKNQRARRLRIREPASNPIQGDEHAFHVIRWRIDETDETVSQESAPSKSTRVVIVERRSSWSHRPGGASHTWLVPPSMIFPLSTDHLLHLVQHNVFRALVSNKRTLNTLLTGWTDAPPSPATCPISCPRYRDDTTVYPLNPNIPQALVPTRLQQTRLHSFWINSIPFPCMRDNLVRHQDRFDHWELLQDLIGELMAATPAENQFATTADRKGLVVWGEPHLMQSWEATPGFITKWAWAVKGCVELLESSNRWRSLRGEEPIASLESQKSPVPLEMEDQAMATVVAIAIDSGLNDSLST